MLGWKKVRIQATKHLNVAIFWTPELMCTNIYKCKGDKDRLADLMTFKKN